MARGSANPSAAVKSAPPGGDPPRYRVGKAVPVFGDHLGVTLAARPLGPNTVGGDSGEFEYFAGPVYVPARHRCVQWGGDATLLLPANFEPRGYYYSAYRSRWEHCR